MHCPPQASLSLLGAASQTLYVKPLLERIGLQAEVLARGEYKTAAEPVLRESMSEPQREQLGALLESFSASSSGALAARPGFDADASAGGCSRAGSGPRSRARTEAADRRLLLRRRAAERARHAEGRAALQPCARTRYLAWRARAAVAARCGRCREIAVVHVHGAITHGAALAARVRGPRRFAGRRRRRCAARGSSRHVRAVLLHVDSPGGSALASDLIHREVVRLREKKPVVAYLGDVAASGGYYVAAPCKRIVAQPTTVTGSIGVISVRLLGGRLAERIGVRPQTLRSAPHADMPSPFRVLDDDERAHAHGRDRGRSTRRFVGVVAEGRKRPREEIEPWRAGGSGRAPTRCALGLVDELGGLDRALAALRELTPELRELASRRTAS